MMKPAARGRRPPVTLRDFLELGCESSNDGFRSYPRRLPSDEAPACVPKDPPPRPHFDEDDAELSPTKSPSWSPSAFFLTKSPAGPLARISTLSRTFSRRISFWRRREYDDDDDGFDVDDRDSCGFPSPLVSSCCSSSASAASEPSEYAAESETTDIVIEESTSSSSAAPPVFEEVSAGDRDCRDDVPGDTAGDVQQALGDDGDPAVGRRGLETMEDKQQLSPVSVLDFPLDDEEERSDAGTCSPSSFLQHRSHHSCAAANLQLQRKKKEQVLHKNIRRFDGPTTEEVADHLEARFTTSSSSESGEESVVDDDSHGRCAHLPTISDDDDDSEAAKTSTVSRHDDYEEHRSIDERRSQQGQDEEAEPAADDEHCLQLLARLLDAASAAYVDEITEWLLLDFFVEGMRDNDDVKFNKATAALVDAATDWVRGAGPRWGVGDVMFSGESALKDMERGRRWMLVRDEEEERDVAAEVEASVTDRLVDDLVAELAPLLVPRCAGSSQ